MREIRRILIVDDYPLVLKGLKQQLLRAWDVDVLTASTFEEAVEALRAPLDLVITDVVLPDGDGIKVALAASRRRPVPVVIAMSGLANASDGFHLAQAGVAAYLQKPFTLEALETAIESAVSSPPSFLPFLPAQVGRIALKEALEAVRHQMLEQALALVGGSRRAAARLLRVSRQAVQQMLE